MKNTTLYIQSSNDEFRIPIKNALSFQAIWCLVAFLVILILKLSLDTILEILEGSGLTWGVHSETPSIKPWLVIRTLSRGATKSHKSPRLLHLLEKLWAAKCSIARYGFVQLHQLPAIASRFGYFCNWCNLNRDGFIRAFVPVSDPSDSYSMCVHNLSWRDIPLLHPPDVPGAQKKMLSKTPPLVPAWFPFSKASSSSW